MKPLVVLSSVIANKPRNGGNARMVLNWLEGLRQLGVDVFFVEQLQSVNCAGEASEPVSPDASINRTYFHDVISAYGFDKSAALICDGDIDFDRATIYGATHAELRDLAGDADLLINISGHLSIQVLKDTFRRKAYVDLDPGYTQMWHAQGSPAARLEGHDVYFTVGQCIGKPACSIPTSGITWRPLRQPIVLQSCPLLPAGKRFTTIASWRGAYAPITYGGQTFRVKAHEFRAIAELPRLFSHPFEIALDIHPGDANDLQALQQSGWRVVDPRTVAATPEDYCGYIANSAAECSAAQGMYVRTNSGWFSDRTAWYLACGRPALIQDTGFVEPTRSGEGLVVFDTLEHAAAGAERIVRDYDAHSAAARSIAERYFDSDVQLARVLDQCGVA
jgi:hypothetical protein